MSLSLYNTLTKREEEFTPLSAGKVSMYTCGPTVYGRPHIGNYSSFLMADLLRRWLEVGHGLNVTHVKNITDVGHLVADRDTGEDKIEKQAREEFGSVTMESVLGIARKYEMQYVEDERALNLLEPAYRPRATEYISQMKEMVEQLLKSGHAYPTKDGIYFDVTSKTLTPYGSLSGNTVENLSAGARVDINEEKKHPADFALWKFCVGVNENHVLRWESPHGSDGKIFPEGFPGWHIECSAMSRSLLGDRIDIHTGGEDNIFPHHECEIAQSEAVTGKQFVSLWLHKRRIDVEGEKMSKSLGNVLTIPNIIDAGYDPMDLRYYFLSVHYRTNLKFSWKGVEDAHKARRKIVEWMSDVEAKVLQEKFGSKSDASAHTALEKFSRAMNADVNTSSALAEIFSFMTHYNSHSAEWNQETLLSVHTFVHVIRHTFGCFEPKEEGIPANVQTLLDARLHARAQKNFAESDRLRGEIAKLGYEVRDAKGEQVVRKM